MFRIWVRQDWSQDRWRDALGSARLSLDRMLEATIDASRPERFELYVMTRDKVETVEFYRTGLELEGDLSPLFDPVWIAGHLREHREHLALIEADASFPAVAQRQGVRKIIRKWNEHAVYAVHRRNSETLTAFGQNDAVEAELSAWRRWYGRVDRKAFDGSVAIDDDMRALAKGRFGPNYTMRELQDCLDAEPGPSRLVHPVFLL